MFRMIMPMTNFIRTVTNLPMLVVALLMILLAGCNDKIDVTGTAFPDEVTTRIEQGTSTPKFIPTASIVITKEQPPTILPTLTRAEEIFLETRLDNPQSAISSQECGEILKTQEWCNVVTDVMQLFRSEWEQLFPHTGFYLEKYDLFGGEFVQKLSLLIVEQDGQRYTPMNYDLLLDANGIVVTDENRELIAKAWALMTIPSYLESEVVFTEWQAVEMPNALHNFNYCLDGWAKMRGLKAKWCFVFGNTQLKIASGPGMQEYQIGEYLESDLPDPEFLDYYFYIR